MRRIVDLALGAVTALVLVALYAPIAVVAVQSFVPTRRGRFDWDGAGFSAYGQLLRNRELLSAIANSILVGAVAVAAASVFALLAALTVRAGRGSLSARALEVLIFLPFLLPPIIVGLSLLIAASELGVPRSLGAVAVGHTVFLAALVYRLVLARLDALPASLFEAARDLGATPWQTFLRVTLPNLAAPVGVGALLAFALSFDETMITLFLAGSEPTLPVRLYAMMRSGLSAETNAIVVVVLGTTLVVGAVALLGLRATRRAAAPLDSPVSA